MAHFHGVIDADKHFVIDAATREITNQSDKITLMQNDHNSERFTFEIPREIDGHDMSLCNVVRVHYLNIDTTTKAQNPGFYEVDDLQISPDDNKKIIGSWLISANATKNVGNLNFTIRFKCIADDGLIEYAWSSAIFKGISVGQSYNNSGTVAEEYADIFAQWQARIEALEQGGNSGATYEQIEAAVENYLTENPVDGLTDEQAAEIAENTEARHEHANKELLDDLKAMGTQDILDLYRDGTEPDRNSFVGGLALKRFLQHLQYYYVTEERFEEAIANGELGGTGGSGVYVGSGEMPEGFNIQIDPNGDTPPIPEKTSQLENDSGFVRIEVVEYLPSPSIAKENVLYIVFGGGNGEDNVYEEYIFTDSRFEKIGDSGTEGLSAYQIWLSAGNSGTEADFLASLKGNTPVKGKDYFTEAEKAEIIEEVAAFLDGSVDAVAAIPAYWQAALDEGVEAINTAMQTAGYNKSAFLFYSDVHWNYGSKMSPKLLKYLYQHTAMTKTNFGGDIVNDEANDYDGMAYLWNWRNQLKGLPNHHSVVGNHDDGNSTDNLFNEQYIYGYLLAAEETPDIVRGNSGLYYYIDNTSEKTRYLYLDTAYKGVNDKQQAFVKEALLSTPEGWHIVAISHIWHDTIYSGPNREVGDLNANASILLAMFDNYNSRSGDYAECGGWVEFCIGGHTHLDHDSTSSTGIPIILVATDSQHTGGGASFTYGTDTEASVNGIIADYDNHKIYVIRIGRGESRTINVTSYIATYTNVLPSSVDADGVSIYNGSGYKANTRWSSSSDTETNGEGIYLSGYIPVSKGDIVYLKNVTMDKDINNNGCRLITFTDINTRSSIHNADNLTNLCKAAWDSDGILTSFVVESGISHIRLQADYIGADSIVTINEPIE